MTTTPQFTERQRALIEETVNNIVNRTRDRVTRLVTHSTFTEDPHAAHQLLTLRGAEAAALGYPITDCPLQAEHVSPLGAIFRECWMEAWKLYPNIAARDSARKVRKRPH